jgi:predicted nucleic acid-binding protein
MPASAGVSDKAIMDALVAVSRLSIQLVYDFELHEEALRLANRFGHGASYDAHYLAVASSRGVKLCTADWRFFNSLDDQFSWVHLVE